MNHKNIISVIFTTNQPRVLNFHEFFTNDLLIRKNSKCYIKVGVTLGFAQSLQYFVHIFLEKYYDHCSALKDSQFKKRGWIIAKIQ